MQLLKYGWQTRRLGWVVGASLLAMFTVVLVGDGGFQVNWDTVYEPKYVLYMELVFLLLSTVAAVLIEPLSAQWEGSSFRARGVALLSLCVTFVSIWLVAAVAMGQLLRIYPANTVVLMILTSSTLVASVTLGLSPWIGPYWAGVSSLSFYATCIAIQGFYACLPFFSPSRGLSADTCAHGATRRTHFSSCFGAVRPQSLDNWRSSPGAQNCQRRLVLARLPDSFS